MTLEHPLSTILLLLLKLITMMKTSRTRALAAAEITRWSNFKLKVKISLTRSSAAFSPASSFGQLIALKFWPRRRRGLGNGLRVASNRVRIVRFGGKCLRRCPKANQRSHLRGILLQRGLETARRNFFTGHSYLVATAPRVTYSSNEIKASSSPRLFFLFLLFVFCCCWFGIVRRLVVHDSGLQGCRRGGGGGCSSSMPLISSLCPEEAAAAADEL